MMNLKDFKFLPLVVAISAVACSKGGAPAEEAPSDDDPSITENPVEDVQPGENPPTSVDTGNPARPELTSEECKAQGGQIIGDIGDGAIYQEAYMCPSGEVPAGNIAPTKEGPTAVEGAVCCP